MDEGLQNLLATKEIHWQFNLTRAPWWGGQFERLIGLVKRALQKNNRWRLFTTKRDERSTSRCRGGFKQSPSQLH